MEGTRRINLDLETEAEPITGWLRPEGGLARGFCGYLELIAALEALRSDDGAGKGSADTTIRPSIDRHA